MGRGRSCGREMAPEVSQYIMIHDKYGQTPDHHEIRTHWDTLTGTDCEILTFLRLIILPTSGFLSPSDH